MQSRIRCPTAKAEPIQISGCSDKIAAAIAGLVPAMTTTKLTHSAHTYLKIFKNVETSKSD